MSEATLREPSASPVLPSAVVVSDDPGAHREAQRLLTDAGFTVASPAGSDPTGARPDPGGASLVVLLLASEPSARIEAIREAAARPDVSVIAAMPADAGNALLRRALRAGADGIVLDERLAASLVATVRAVAAGQLALPPRLRRRLAPRPLSYREKEILALVVRGYTNRQIADRLFVAESTVKTHLSSAFGKLDTRSRSEAAALILDPDEGHGLGILPIPGLPPDQAA
jgi:DNA-binding NarL/FixJ family response regulator